MEQYIPKSSVVAEIEKRKKEAYGNEWGWAVQCATYEEIISLLDTFEVKEVDLEKEISRVSKNEYFDFTDWKSIARHFFELGFKARKGNEL